MIAKLAFWISSALGSILGVALFAAAILATFGAYVQHFITAINEEMWVLLVIGVFVFPVGILHVWLVWLGLL